jgi:hypothetical protein
MKNKQTLEQLWLINTTLNKNRVLLKENYDNLEKEHRNLLKEYYIKKFIKSEIKNKKNKINYEMIEINNKKYLLGKTNNKNINDQKYFIANYELKEKIIYLNWKSQKDWNYVYISYSSPIGQIVLYLHNYVMNKLSFNGKGKFKTYDHINRIKTDNRIENLRLFTPTQQNYNQSKKIRTTKLKATWKEINFNNLPRNVFVKEVPNNGVIYKFFKIAFKKFTIDGRKEIDTEKKSDRSINCKFEQAKKILRYIKEKFPEQFKLMNIETEYSKEASDLVKTYNNIIKKSNIVNKKYYLIEVNFTNYIKEDLSKLSKKNLKYYNDFKPFDRKKDVCDNTLPVDCGVTLDMLPPNVQFHNNPKSRGIYFTIKGPKKK